MFFQDKLQYNISDLFYVSASQNLQCTSNDTSTTIVTNGTVLSAKDLRPYGFSDFPEIAEFVSNQTFYAVFDDSTLIIQNISLDGLTFTDTTLAQFGQPGNSIVCTDLHHNPYLARIYVVCQTNFSSIGDKSVFVYELNDQTGSLINSINFTQPANATVAHRLQIRYVEMTAPDRGHPPIPVVIIYDQGLSSGITTSNKWVGVFTIPSRSNLAFNGYAWFINQDNLYVNNLYDVYTYQNHMLVSGKLQNSTTLGLGYCTVFFDNFNNPQLDCARYTVQGQLETSTGFLGLMNTGQLVEINSDPSVHTVQICDLTDNFFSGNFVDVPNCNTFQTYTLINAADAFIAGVEGNIHQVVVKFTHPDSTYAGYTIYNFDMHFEDNHIDDSAAPYWIPLGKSIAIIDQDSMSLIREVPPYAYINAANVTFGPQQYIQITCTDTNNTATNVLNITVLGDMNNVIYTNDPAIPDFDAYPGTEVYFQLNPQDVIGNNIYATVNLDSAVASNGRATLYDLESLSVSFTSEVSSGRYQYLYFNKQYAIAKDTQGKIIVFNCHLTDISDAACRQVAFYATNTLNDQLQPDVIEVFNYLFAWAVDPIAHTTKVYIFDGEHQISSFTIDGMASDISTVEIGDRGYIAAVFYGQGIIRNWFFRDGNPTSFVEIETIHREMSHREFFCPQNVSFLPSIIQGSVTLEILSICPQQDQRILRYQYPPYVKQDSQGHYYTVFNLNYTVPINLGYSNIQVCSVGTEHVIFAIKNGKERVLFSLGMSDDRNVWNFGTGIGSDEFNLGTLLDFSCTPESGMFSIISQAANGSKTLSTWWGNNQYNAAHRLYRSVLGVDSYQAIKSYDWNGNVIHTLRKSDGSFDFMYTWVVGQVVEVAIFPSMPANQNINLNYRFASSGGGIKVTGFTKSFYVQGSHAIAGVSIDSTQVLGGYPTNVTIQIEQFTNFTGDISEARIEGTDLVQLNNRIYRVGEFVPQIPELQTVYSHFETNGYTSVGVHTSPYNSSFFSFFFNINEFNGSYTPVHGVNDFHFAMFPDWNATTLLLAYSTAEPSDNSLQFIVFNGATAVATASTAAHELHNYTDIKVLRLNSSTNGTEAFYVFGHNAQQGILDTWVVTYANGIISFVPHPNDADVDVGAWSFGCGNSTNDCLLLYSSKSNGTLVNAYAFSNVYPVQNAVKRTFNVDSILKNSVQGGALNGNFLITDIECRTQSSTEVFCLFNTYGTRILELTWNASNTGIAPAAFTYYKLPGYEGIHMDATHNYLVYLGASHVSHHPEQREFRYIFFKRGVIGGTGDVFYTQHNDKPRPFTLTTCRHHMTHFQMTGAFRTVPVFFLALQNFSLNVMQGANYSQAQMVIDSVPGRSSEIKVSVSSFAGGYVPPNNKASGSVWPYVIILGLLIGFSVGYAIYNNNKNKTEESVEGSAANYQSLKNDAKTTTNEA